MCPPGRGPLKRPSPWGQERGGPAGAAPGGLAVTDAPSRQLGSQRLAAKAASALLPLGLGEGDVEGLKAEGPGLGHLGGRGGGDGRVAAEGGAEAWRRAVMCCGGEAWEHTTGGGCSPWPSPHPARARVPLPGPQVLRHCSGWGLRPSTVSASKGSGLGPSLGSQAGQARVQAQPSTS